MSDIHAPNNSPRPLPLGPFIVAGPSLAALSGAAVGGLTARSSEWAFPSTKPSSTKDGNILISAHTDDGEERSLAKEIFEKAGAQGMKTTGEASAPS